MQIIVNGFVSYHELEIMTFIAENQTKEVRQIAKVIISYRNVNNTDNTDNILCLQTDAN